MITFKFISFGGGGLCCHGVAPQRITSGNRGACKVSLIIAWRVPENHIPEANVNIQTIARPY